MTSRHALAKRYRDRAEECLRLSELATLPETRQQYRRIAKQYLTLARPEETLAGEVGPGLLCSQVVEERLPPKIADLLRRLDDGNPSR